MENRINLSPLANPYLQQFYVAQHNLRQLIQEERLRKRIERSQQKLNRFS